MYGRCKDLDSLKSLLWYAGQLSRACILCFHILRAHLGSGCSLMTARWQVNLFLPKFPQGSQVSKWLELLMTVTSFVYWYGRWYFISHSQLANTNDQLNYQVNVGWALCDGRKVLSSLFEDCFILRIYIVLYMSEISFCVCNPFFRLPVCNTCHIPVWCLVNNKTFFLFCCCGEAFWIRRRFCLSYISPTSQGVLESGVLAEIFWPHSSQRRYSEL